MLNFDVDRFSGFSGLHCASFFGIVEIVASMAEMECCQPNGLQVEFSRRFYMYDMDDYRKGKMCLVRVGQSGKLKSWCI